MTENPFEPTISSIADVKEPVPHTASVRAEAWRGFKFGARITGIVMSVIVGVVLLPMIGLAVYAMVVTEGAVLSKVDYSQLASGIGASIMMVLLSSFYGGIAGGMIMVIAAIVSKRRTQNTNSKAA